MLRWIVDEQVYVFDFAVPFDELCPEVCANFFEDNFEPIDRVSVQYLSSLFGDEDQVDIQCEYAKCLP